MKLTAAAIAVIKLPDGKDEIVRFDERLPGFGYRLRRRSKGIIATWIYQYGDRKITIGLASALPPAKAFSIAGDLAARVRLGGDPLAEKQTARAERALHFRVVAEKYLDHQKTELRASSFVETQRHLLKNAAALHSRPLAEVDRSAVAACLNDIANNRGAVTANRARANISAMFSWAMKQGIAESNPVIGTIKREERARDRVLTDRELAIVWHALGDDDFGRIIKLMALTGQREAEIAGLRWSEIDFDRATITLPALRTKNGYAHDVPMSKAAAAILTGQPKVDGQDLVFARRGDKPFASWTAGKIRLAARIRELNKGKELPHFVFHDLRRTFVTRACELGVQPHVVEAVVNHQSGHKAGVAGVYNKAVYANEKRQALNLWAAHVAAVVEGRESNVTPLKRA
jgi:integrase